MRHSKPSSNYCCLVKTVVNKAIISKLIDVLAICIKQEQVKQIDIESTGNKHYKENNWN